MNPRFIAYQIIYDVKHKQKYSNIVINQVFNQNKLTKEDKNFVTFVVYGVLSNTKYLDYFIKKYSTIGFSKISKQARVVLEIAFFEIIFMNSSVNYATVNECVKLAQKCDKRAKNFVNALLRKITSQEENIKRAKNYDFKDIKNKIERISTKYSVSEYIAKRLVDNYDSEFIEKLMLSMSKTPKIFIRANSLKSNFEDFRKELEKLNPNYEVVDEQNRIFALKNFKNIADSTLYKEGLFSIQDYASMLCVLQLEPKKYETILDICSAPGGKSMFIAQLMQNKGTLISTDISENKLDLLEEQSKRLGIQIVQTKACDATIYNEDFANKFDRILADVPCSGIGIIRRKPEIRYKKFEDIDDILNIQKKILENSSKYLKENGTLVYSTCTLGKEENKTIVDEFLKKNKNFKLINQKEYYPHIDDTDGFFVCKMIKDKE